MVTLTLVSKTDCQVILSALGLDNLTSNYGLSDLTLTINEVGVTQAQADAALAAITTALRDDAIGAEKKTAKLEEIKAAFEATTANLISNIPEGEQKTWAVQIEQAKIYLADNTAPTPRLDILVASRSVFDPTITKAYLAPKIIQKKQSLEGAGMFYLGRYHGLVDKVLNLPINPTQAELDAITW